MDLECKFCKKIFSNKATLNTHQKTTKYCLKIQGTIESITFNCNYCSKSFTTKQYLLNHLNICKEKENQEKNDEFQKKIKEIENKYQHELKEKLDENENIHQEEISKLKKYNQEEISKLKKQITELNIKIANYEGQIIRLEDDHEIVKEIAKQTKNTTHNTTNNLNITTSIDFNNVNKIRDVIESDYDINYAIEGQKGVAKFVTDKFLRDENGDLIYFCSDPSRQVYKYKDSTGQIKKDIEAKKITNYIVYGGIKEKTNDLANDWYRDENGDIIMEKFNIMIEKQQSISRIDRDNNCFKKELAAITTQ